MTYEISQLDIPDRQLLPTAARSRTTLSTEIGEAIITHTIFGRAKVRIIRKHDKMRRTLWLMVLLLGVAVAAAAAWQGWMAAQQAEPVQTAEQPPALSTNVQESTPAPQPEYLAQPAAVPPVESKPVTTLQAGTEAPIGQKPALLGANSTPARIPVDTQQPLKPVPARQPVTVAKPRVLQPVTQPAASSPAAVAPLAVPLAKEDAPVPAPAGNKPAAPVNVQP